MKRHSKREKRWKEQGGSAVSHSLSEYVYYNWKHLLLTAVLRCDTSAVWTCFTSYNTRKWLCSLSLCAIVFRSPPASHVSTSNSQRSSQLFCVHRTPIFQRRSSRHVSQCCSNGIRSQCCAFGHPCTVIQGHCCTTKCFNSETKVSLRCSPTDEQTYTDGPLKCSSLTLQRK
jgi:hypothetical protein